MDGIDQSRCFEHWAGIANHLRGYGEQADSMAISLDSTPPIILYNFIRAKKISVATRSYFALLVWIW